MTETWWRAAAELAPGAPSTCWPRIDVPVGKVLHWTSMALRVRISGLDLGNMDEVEVAARLIECVRSNSFLKARVGGGALLVVRADELPSPFGIAPGAPPFKDVTVCGRPVMVLGNEGLSFELRFDASKCECTEPHSLPVRLELSVNGTIKDPI